MGLTSVPGQVSAGLIDGLLRDDAGDGTLGLPDYSLVPYVYAPLLGPVDAAPQWVIDKFRLAAFAGFKGTADGLGALRLAGSDRSAAMITAIPQATGTRGVSPDGSRAPDFTWGPRDLALVVRHPGATTWSSASAPLSYIVLTQASNSIGMRLTVPASAQGPWDAELADSAAIPLPAGVNVWDGNAHSFAVSTFGQNAFCVVDEVIGFPFRAPRAYKRNANGTTDTAVHADMSATGPYVGYDTRGVSASLFGWNALQPASGDFFLYDMGATAVQTAPATTYTPTTLPSGETWSLTGTVTGSKNGVLLAANAAASFTLAHPYGLLCTQWGTAVAEGGLVFRRVDASNYYQVTSTGLYSVVGGTQTKFFTFPTPIAAGAHVAVRNWANQFRVYVNGVSVAFFTASFHAAGAGVGFRSPAAGTSQWRYLAFQPMVTSPTLPTT
ncbi:hypothetical protein [Streptomyces griseoaurantiacus]|uniref:hypothetical protein n=1 Tax=Streptomyces griseoaurantiacus TaxID=68213 RepID=UPI00367C4478